MKICYYLDNETRCVDFVIIKEHVSDKQNGKESGGMKMLNYYISELKNWWNITIPAIINEENFLLIVGGLFLLGVVTKWAVVRNYGRLIRKAENINNTKNYTIRQRKTKYESIKQVNGQVENPMLFVKRSLNKCKIMHIPANKINNIINWCSILIMGVAVILSLQLYKISPVKMDWVSYLVLGCFFGVVLEMIGRMMQANEKKTELSYVLVDVLVNGVHKRHVRERESFIELVSEPEKREQVTLHENINGQAESIVQNQRTEEEQEEEVLNQVIGEFLQ